MPIIIILSNFLTLEIYENVGYFFFTYSMLFNLKFNLKHYCLSQFTIVLPELKHVHENKKPKTKQTLKLNG